MKNDKIIHYKKIDEKNYFTQMNLIKIKNHSHIEGETIKLIADVLKKGKIAILPTSTIYGISCIYNNRKAIEKVYDIKGRKKTSPFIILISDISIIPKLVESITDSAYKLMNYFWLGIEPEPLTLIFKKNRLLESFIASGSNNIAIRLDNLNLLKEAIHITGPIISTSANISGSKILPSLLDEIPRKIKNQTDLIVDYGEKLPGTASSIIDVTAEKPVIIREGKIKNNNVLRVLKVIKDKTKNISQKN
ncbi:MAG: L-threonylcarbamoyladenylate synthase [Actinobacteria bacterium]|nr:L-threonylcarbamoyladenylate synthase [Actinomycetota bacterium]